MRTARSTGRRDLAVRQRLRVPRAHRVVELLGLAGFVVGVYVVVVLGGGALIGRTDSPSTPLSVVATAVVALMFAPVQSRLQAAARRLWGGGPGTPYDVLSRFAESVTVGRDTEELPGRMSMLLAQGTGAAWAQVWLSVSDRLTLAATWPVDAAADRNPPDPGPDVRPRADGAARTLAVRHGGELLGVLRLQERPGLRLTAVEQRLFSGLAAQAGLVLRLQAVRAELEARHLELVVRADELRVSRERLIATQDAERRRLERDIHDGAQQHLVALAVNLRLAQTVAARAPERVGGLLAEQAIAAREAVATLSALSRGIYPRLLAADGLAPALRSAVAAGAIPVDVVVDGVGRLPAPVEAALYFCCMEAVQNAAKHSGASCVTVRLARHDGSWRASVTDDGVGFDESVVSERGGGAGLVNMRDRLDAVGGTVTVTSRPGMGTTVAALVPEPTPGVGSGETRVPSPRVVS